MAEEVIIFARSLPFHHLGGMEVVAWDLAVQLQVKGFKVTVVTTDFDEDIPVLENTPQIIKLKISLRRHIRPVGGLRLKNH